MVFLRGEMQEHGCSICPESHTLSFVLRKAVSERGSDTATTVKRESRAQSTPGRTKPEDGLLRGGGPAAGIITRN